MFELIKKMLGSETAQPTDEDTLNAPFALAVLFMEAAYADGECSQEEKEHLAQTLVNTFHIPKEEIQDLIERSDKAHHEYVSLFQYTCFINDNLSRDQKRSILEAVWRIILLDDHLEAHEDHFVHKLGNLLGFGHKDLMDAKRTARQQLP